MQTPSTPSPFSFAACCAAAGTPLTATAPVPVPSADPVVAASLAQIAAVEASGRQVRSDYSFAEMAQAAWDLHDALYSLQSDGIRGADAVDLRVVEDLASLLEALRDEQGRVAA